MRPLVPAVCSPLFFADASSPIASTPNRKPTVGTSRPALATSHHAPPPTPSLSSLSPMRVSEKPLQRHEDETAKSSGWGGIFSPVLKFFANGAWLGPRCDIEREQLTRARPHLHVFISFVSSPLQRKKPQQEPLVERVQCLAVLLRPPPQQQQGSSLSRQDSPPQRGPFPALPFPRLRLQVARWEEAS